MRFLFTADFQTEFENLDLCSRAWSQMLDVCRERKLTGVAFLGDLKRAYNPVDVRVTQFWSDLIDQAARGYHLDVVLLLGNHDRVGMYADAQNWFPVLKRAGAIVADTARSIELRNDGKLACLPFTTQHGLWRKRSEQLAKNAASDKILLFHQELD